MQIIDSTNIPNDFIHKLVDYYLEEISSKPPDDIFRSIANITNTIMSYYLLVRKNNELCTDNDTISIADSGSDEDILLNQCKKLNYDNSAKDKSYLPQIDELLDNHEKFMLDISKQSLNIKTVENDFGTNTIIDESPTKNTNIISQSAIEIMEKNSIHEKHMDKLDEAFNKLYSRINTPFVNLVIVVVVLKFTTYLFGF